MHEYVRLQYNESAYGASPKVSQFNLDHPEDFQFYPNGSQEPLVTALSDYFKLPKDNFFALSGSSEGIATVMRTLLNSGDEVVSSPNGFPPNFTNISSYGGEVITVNDRDDRAYIDGLLDAITPKTKLVLLCNPNNPTGTYIPKSEIKRLYDNLPEHVYLLLDSAYAEYGSTYDDYDCGLELFSTTGRLIISRTFSKAYGLASLRIGFIIIPDDFSAMVRKIPVSYSISTRTLELATIALNDQDFLNDVIQKNKTVREMFSQSIRDLGLKTIEPNATNFLMIEFPDATKNGVGAYEYLFEKKIITQAPAPGKEHRLRITLGTMEIMQEIAGHLADYLNA